MNKIKMFIAKQFFKELLPVSGKEQDASGSSGGGAGRELASEFVKRVTYKENNDTDFEDPDFDLEDIQNGYNTDSYIRQGVDKYVDQIFKEGYSFYGTDANAVEYLKLRLSYIAEASNTPTNQLLMDIAEDIVKYGNCMVVKARSNDPNALPQGTTVTGLYGKDPVAGYFCANPVTMKCKRDEFGTITEWQQDNDGGTQTFAPEDVVHFYYKREKGNAYGTSFLIPVLDDVRALRQAEENVLKMMYRNIYPFYHVAVGTEEQTGTTREVEELKSAIDGMDVEGGLVTTERVKITPIASDKVIDAEPYLKYMESRVFSGMGIPEIMFGRGNTANRSTGDNMTSEMADRIRAMCRVIEMFFNSFIIKELLMEGGYDPVLNPDQAVEFRFNDNDVDVMIKKQVHAIYKYEHNAITEDEMRDELGMDPIPDGDRAKLFVELITRETLRVQAELNTQVAKATATQTGTAETNNKQKNQGGKSSGGSGNKKSSSQSKNSIEPQSIGLVKDSIDNMENSIDNYIKECFDTNTQITQAKLMEKVVACNKEIMYIISRGSNSAAVEDISTRMAKLSTNLLNQIHTDMIGVNTLANTESSVIDIIDVRVSIYKDSLIKYIQNYKSMNATLIERGS
nr:MAG TPA: Portal protein [Caudoviricetes sp.]